MTKKVRFFYFSLSPIPAQTGFAARLRELASPRRFYHEDIAVKHWGTEMNAKQVWYLVVFDSLFLILVNGCRPERAIAQSPGEPPDAAMAGDILRATVTIDITGPFLDANGAPQSGSDADGRTVPLQATSRALGTIVSAGEGDFIVTTDHYDQLAAAYGIVTFTDYEGNQVELSLAAFRSLIRYQGNAVLILVAPPGLPTGLEPGDGDQIMPGNTLHVVYRQPDSGALSVVAAEVVHWTDCAAGGPSFHLHNLNGEVVEHGNSGGGVWYGGRLVGVIERSILVKPGTDEIIGSFATPGAPSDMSYATRLSPVRFPLLNRSQPIAARME